MRLHSLLLAVGLLVLSACGGGSNTTDGGSAGGTAATGGGSAGGEGGGNAGGEGGGNAGGEGGGSAGGEAGGSGGSAEGGSTGGGGGGPSVTLTVMKTGNGAGVVVSTPAGIVCGPDCTFSYARDRVVTLSASADMGSRFLGWTGGGCTGSGDCTLTLTEATTVTAAFGLELTLVVTKTGSGSGTVSSSPAGIDCGADCDERYLSGTQVTLTATPAAGSTFTGWSMGCSGIGACTVTLDVARMVTATFVAQQHALSVTRAGSGTGTVTSTPAGITCGATCSALFAAGGQVALTAAPAMGSTFAGWSGGGCSGTGACIVTVNAATTVTATFTASSYTVRVVLAGTGTGTVASAPTGINCGTDCTEDWPYGTMVQLVPVAGASSQLVSWSGGGCSGTGSCTVTVTAATTVTATFDIVRYLLTVTRSGTGSGTVTSVPAGISCGSDCSEAYVSGTMVTLTAAPQAGSTFTGWSGGGCSGTGACTVTLSAAANVTATFAVIRHALTTTRTGTGMGTITSSPAGISCGTDCSEVYDEGTSVTLTATPAMGSTFVGWTGGGCSGQGTCTVQLGGNLTVSASFSGCPSGSATLAFTAARQSFTVPSCVTSITVDARGAAGGSGWNFDNGGSVKGLGGLGGRVRATLAVSPNEVLWVTVGGAGQNAIANQLGVGGFNGGGNGSDSAFGYAGGGGGGATDVRRGMGALSERILVAGGGGSGSGWCTTGAGSGGAGGGLIGASGGACLAPVGTGGTQTAGGTTNGAFGQGGSTGLMGMASEAGSAGGGGWYGGGASNNSGGGGGSSYTLAGATNVMHTQGVHAGDGTLTITW